jgi:hypothetical protein
MTRGTWLRVACGTFALLFSAAAAAPVAAQNVTGIENYREQYDLAMANFQRVAEASGDVKAARRAADGRAAMRSLTDQQLANLFSKTRVPNFSVVSMAAGYLASRAESFKTAQAPKETLTPVPLTPGFPNADPIDPGCDGVDISSGTRYTQLIAREVTNSILAAAAWVCNEDILGENGSAACVPLAIAADVANGFFDTSAWCAGEVTANQVDGNYRRLDHIHSDLEGAITSIVNNDNQNAASIINNDNANATTLFNNDNANRTLIINNANTNTTSIINNDNANTATILNNANANKNELRDLILRTQIEQDLSMADNAAVVAIFETPTANGGYLDLVTTIVTDTIAKIQASGGSTSNAQQFLNTANAAKAAGDFKAAYASYRKAYKAAGK